MALQQKVIQRLLKTLQGTSNSNVTELLDTAVLSCRSRYHTIQEVVDECLRERGKYSDYVAFLKERCGIVLDNADTGALIGFDACGGNIQTDVTIVPEESILEWEFPVNQENYYGTLKVIYNPPADNDQRFIIGALHTWWIPKALHLIADSYGFEFNSPEATPKELIVVFKSAGAGVLAYIETVSDLISGKVTAMQLVINTDLYVNMDISNPNGLSLSYPGIGYLDRCIAHEFVHAVEATNIDFFHYLAQNYLWFTEGSAELVHGIDDERIYNITQLMQDQNRFAQAFTQNPANVEDPYSAGYILLRYFARQVANGYTQKFRVKRHLMTERGTVKTLKEIGERFIQFALKSNNGVQPWKLADGGLNSYKKLSSFYGETLKVPMKNHADMNSKDKYYLLTSPIFQFQGNGMGINFIDVLTAQYQNVTVSEDYSVTDLDDVENKVTALTIDASAHILFSGCELSINKGEKAVDIIVKLKDIITQIRNRSNSRPSLILTPTLDMYSNGVLREEYKILLRSSFISRKLTMVCIGDNITAVGHEPVDYPNYSSWTDFCQIELPNINIVNKGFGGDNTAGVLARFNTDVIEQAPDLCFILIGGNELWTDSPGAATQTKVNFKQMIDICLNNNITPIVGLYVPTLDQLEFLRPMNLAAVKDNFADYYRYCKSVAIDNNLVYVDVYTKLRNVVDGSINMDYFSSSDLIHPQRAGREVMGKYIASQIKDLIFEKQLNTNIDCDIINLYDVFCNKLGVDELTVNQLNSLINNGHYDNENASEYITEHIFSEGLLTPFQCPCFYISLEHMNIKTDTYNKWLKTSYDPGEPYKHSIRDLNFYDTKIYYQSEKYEHEASPTYNLNLFKNTGEFIAVGLHTLYDADLWMCEQGGITCENEGTNQVANMNWLVKNYEVDAKKLPVFPGTGCPWLTISDKNKEDLNIEDNGITYWFTKSDYDATITIKVGDGVGEDVYQSISLGMMTSVNDESYLFPLYVAGGTQGISEDIYTFTLPRAISPTYLTGNMYDLDIKRISMSNSNLLTPTKFNKSSVSNFRILAPSGKWKDIFTYKQDTEVKPYPTCSGSPSIFYVVLKEVESVGVSEHSVLPFMGDAQNMVDIYTVGKKLNIYEHFSQLDKIVVSLNGALDYGENGCMGVIPNCYSSWYRTLGVGEVDLGGIKYLSVPNGWNKRLWFYPWKIGFYPQGKEDWDAEYMEKYWSSFFSLNSTKFMTHRLLIPLEEEGE